jgi:hypothetical protein
MIPLGCEGSHNGTLHTDSRLQVLRTARNISVLVVYTQFGRF